MIQPTRSARRSPGHRIGVLCALGALALPALAGGQAVPADFDPSGDWRTVETDRFQVHFPADAAEWILPLVARMEGMREAVDEAVGRGPEDRVTVVVADPFEQPGGYVVPLLDRPLTTLWPTPPAPTSGIGEYREWGELLFIHEYVHIAHVSYPRRHPVRGPIRHLLPAALGPIILHSPRWIVEGYATLLEGRLTGQGRPFGTALPAFVRQRALEGRLPTYGELSGAWGFEDGLSAYLLGAAFIQWLEEREGEESLEHLWRRLSARERRSFADAFSGVFRGPPEELYGEFTAEVTGKALEVRDILDEAGLEKGELWALRRWSTGAPAVSPDGETLAVTLYERGAPGRLVVKRTEEDEEAIERREERREELLERDPEDVPAVDWRPPPRETVAELDAFLGRSHRNPRFLPHGDALLVIRNEPLSDGRRSRPDLFVWDFREDDLQRITRGAGIRHADPSPDGTEAVASRCRWGRCDLVRVDLESGELTTVARGAPGGGYHRPRWAPDREEIVVSVRDRTGRWRLTMVSLGENGGEREVDPDDRAVRYDAEFLGDGDALVVVSTRGGIPNLERLDLETGEIRPLTRVLGEVAAPAPDPVDGGIHFLHRHSRGWDIRRVDPDAVDPGEVVELPEELWPAARAAPPEPVPEYEPEEIPEPEPYGWGSHGLAPLPGHSSQEAGHALHLGLSSSDPIGRATLVAQGAVANSEVWAGASLGGVVRRLPLPVRGEAFVVRQRPSGEAQRTGPLDARMAGGLAGAAAERVRSRSGARARVLASGARVEGADGTFSRASGLARLTASVAWDGPVRIQPRVHGQLEGGRTAGEGWTRLRAGGGTALRLGGLSVRVDGEYGRQNGGPVFEGFRVGGPDTPLFDRAALAQEAPEPVFPTALLQGTRLGAGQVRVGVGAADAFLRLWSADDDLSRWHRVAGLEQRLELGPFPEAGIPVLRARAGVAHSFDDPFRDRTRAYLSVEFRP